MFEVAHWKTRNREDVSCKVYVRTGNKFKTHCLPSKQELQKEAYCLLFYACCMINSDICCLYIWELNLGTRGRNTANITKKRLYYNVNARKTHHMKFEWTKQAYVYVVCI